VLLEQDVGNVTLKEPYETGAGRNRKEIRGRTTSQGEKRKNCRPMRIYGMGPINGTKESHGRKVGRSAENKFRGVRREKMCKSRRSE